MKFKALVLPVLLVVFPAAALAQQKRTQLSAAGIDGSNPKDLRVPYIVKANEGHGFANEENRFDFTARWKSFWANILAEELRKPVSEGQMVQGYWFSLEYAVLVQFEYAVLVQFGIRRTGSVGIRRTGSV